MMMEMATVAHIIIAALLALAGSAAFLARLTIIAVAFTCGLALDVAFVLAVIFGALIVL